MARESTGSSSAHRSSRKRDRICPICNRAFTKQDHLERHVRSHTQEKPFSCKACGKGFSRNDTLLRHERSHLSTPSTSSAQFGVGQDAHTQLHSGNGSDSLQSGYMDLSGNLNHPGSVSTTVQDLNDQISILAPEFLSPEHQFDPNIHHDPQNLLPLDVWGIDPVYYSAPWSLANDINIGAIDSALNATISEWAQGAQPLASNTHHGTLPQSSAPMETEKSNPGASHELHPTDPEELVCLQWFTRLKPEESRTLPSRAASEGPTEQYQVDERYRDSLSRKLRPHQFEDAQLSVDFLNLCLRLYFTRFHPILPLVHIPTFRPNSQNALLFLSMCSIGSLFIGSADAAAKGHKIFARLNKAILASWETIFAAKKECLSMVQASFLGQTFGLLSGRPKDLMLVDTFNGTLVAWTRKITVFPDQKIELPAGDIDLEELDLIWKRWIYQEHLARLGILMYLHDAEMANLFHHDSLIRLQLVKYSTVVQDDLFQAPTAEQWLTLANGQSNKKRGTVTLDLHKWALNHDAMNQTISSLMNQSDFVSYGILENISAAVVEARQARTLRRGRKEELHNLLMGWYKARSRKVQSPEQDSFHLQILWHTCFMCLYADFDQLEQVIGRDGPASAKLCLEDATAWATSLDAMRCLLHGHLIQNYVESMRLSDTPALHIPRALFLTGLAWLCFYRFSTAQMQMATWAQKAQGFPEVELIAGSSQQLQARIRAFPSKIASQQHPGLVCDMIDLLRKTGRWGISESFANILTEALRGRVDV